MDETDKNITLVIENKEYKAKNIFSGKSGLGIFLITIDGKDYIFKYIKHSKYLKTDFKTIYSESDLYLTANRSNISGIVPKIYKLSSNGIRIFPKNSVKNYMVTATSNNDVYTGFIMENVKTNDYIELDEFLTNFCSSLTNDIKNNKDDVIKDDFKRLEVFKNIIINLVKYTNTDTFMHCDLHPLNIFIHTRTGAIKLIDFGLSKFNLSEEPKKLSCDKQRSSTKKLMETSNKCFGKSLLFQLDKINIFNSKSFSENNLSNDNGMIYEYIKIYNRIKSKVEKRMLRYIENNDTKLFMINKL
jgi:serine/threonine protein kinase